MTVSRTITVGLGVAAGLVAGVAIYTGAAGATTPTRSPAPAAPAAATSQPRPTQYAPCVSPAKLEHGVCVTHKVVTKVLPAPAPADPNDDVNVAQPSSPLAAPTTSATSRVEEHHDDGKEDDGKQQEQHEDHDTHEGHDG